MAHEVYGTDNGESVDILALAGAGGVKLQGRDAATLLLDGGAENMIQMLSLHQHGNLLENHEKCSTLIQQLTHNEKVFQTKADEKQLLLKQLLLLKNYESEELTEDGDLDFNALFGAIETETESYLDYKDEATVIGKDIISLYKAETLNNAHNKETVELDQMSANTLKVFMALKALTLPIIRPSSDDPARFKADMADHSIRAQNFIDSLTARKEMKINSGTTQIMCTG